MASLADQLKKARQANLPYSDKARQKAFADAVSNKKTVDDNNYNSDKSDKNQDEVDGTDSNQANTDSNNDPNKELETGTGLAFGGQMSTQIIHDIMYKFVLGDLSLNNHGGYLDLLYHFTSGGYQYGVRDLIDVAIPGDATEWILEHGNKYNIYNVDESMIMDPMQFMSYQGSILNYIRDISNAPFNEIFWTYEQGDAWEDAQDKEQAVARQNLMGKTPPNPYEKNAVQGGNIPRATMHVRQTPFEPSQWYSLPVVYLEPDEIISTEFDINDTDQYSIFNLSGTQETLQQVKVTPPVTDDAQELQRRYGYKTMDVQSDYFTNNHSNIALSPSQKAQVSSQSDEDELNINAKMSYPSFETFNMYFKTDSDNFKSHDIDNYPIAKINGGDALYEFVMNTLENNYAAEEGYQSFQAKEIERLQNQLKDVSDENAKRSLQIKIAQMKRAQGKHLVDNSLRIQQEIVTSPLNVAKYYDAQGNLTDIPGKYIISYQAAAQLVKSFNETLRNNVMGVDADNEKAEKEKEEKAKKDKEKESSADKAVKQYTNNGKDKEKQKNIDKAKKAYQDAYNKYYNK